MLAVAACEKASSHHDRPVEASSCDADGADRAALFQRGVALIDPHMLLADRKAGPRDDDEVRRGIACLDRALAIEPTSVPALWFRGKGYQALGEQASAVASFRAAYRLQPDQVDVGRELVEALLRTDAVHDATPIAESLARSHPTDAGLAANAALAQLLDGRVADAKATIEHARALDAADPVTQALQQRIDEVARGVRPQPKTMHELESK